MKPTRKRKDGLERQSQIIKKSLELFSEKGYHNTKIMDILKSLKIAKGTFYLHFDSKEDLLNTLVNRYLKQLYSSLSKLDISMDKPIEEVKKMYIEVSRTLINNKEYKMFVKIMLKEISGSNIKIAEKLDKFYNRIIDMSAVYIQNAQKKGRLFQNIDSKYISMSIVGSIKELVYQWAINESIEDLESAISNIADVYFRGMIKQN